jgi:hypothetical protein
MTSSYVPAVGELVRPRRGYSWSMYQQPDVTTYNPTLVWEEGMIATIVCVDSCSEFVQVLTNRGSVGWIFPSIFLPCVDAENCKEQSHCENDKNDSNHEPDLQPAVSTTFFSSLLQRIRDLFAAK